MRSATLRWRPAGASGALYRLCRAFYGQPQRHPRVTGLLFRRLFRGVVLEEQSTKTRIIVDVNDYIASELLNSGGYEPHSLNLAFSLMRAGDVFVDVGANIGLYAIPIASLVGVSVIAVDGSVPALARLWTNAALNMTKPEIVSAVVSRRHSLAKMCLPCAANLGAARQHDEADRTAAILNYSATSSLQEILRLAGDRPIRLLKVDAEGSELDVLSSFDWNYPHRPEHILIELWSTSEAAQSTFALLKEVGYIPRTVNGEALTELRAVPEDNVWFTDSRPRLSGLVSGDP
jgi:FkbM family methyltransferase